jgi:hypothetical protein
MQAIQRFISTAFWSFTHVGFRVAQVIRQFRAPAF